MPRLTTNIELFENLEKSGLLPRERLDAIRAEIATLTPIPDTRGVLRKLLNDGEITAFHAKQLLAGRFKGFFLADKYKILAHIGTGGMGQVYLCEHLNLHKLVAIKVLQRNATSESGLAVERFVREARAVASLEDPNIVRVFDMERSGPAPFMVMEFIDGTNLHALVQDHGKLNPHRAANYILQSARGLQHAFEVGLVHRDIKPGNLLLDRTGVVKLADLGLARHFTDTAKNANLTAQYQTKGVIGTVDFIAPEQTHDSSAVDIRADIYSLGCTFYYLLAGQAPFEEGSIAQKLLWHQTRDPQPIAEFRIDVPEEMLAILAKMLQKDPANRFQTPAEAIAALEPWSEVPAVPSPEEMPEHSAASYRLGLSQPPSNPTGTAPSIQPMHTPKPGSATRQTLSGGFKILPDQPATSPGVLRPKKSSLVPPTLPQPMSNRIPQPRSTTAVNPILPDPKPEKNLRVWLLAVGGILATLAITIGIILATQGGSKPTVSSVPTTTADGHPSQVPITGGGSTFVLKIMNVWCEEYTATSTNKIEYIGRGSGEGLEALFAKRLDFACTDVAMSRESLDAAPPNFGEVIHLPLVVGACVPTYNLPGIKEHLKFSGPVLADIYLGKITHWNDDAIQLTNPTIKLPDLPIHVIYRKDKSGTTFLWSDFLSRKSGEWKEKMKGPAFEYNSWPVGKGVNKNLGVAKAVAQTTGALGYIELTDALAENLQVGEVRNRADKFVDPRDPTKLAAAAASMKAIPFDLRFSIVDMPGDDSYPIAGVVFAVFAIDRTNPAKTRALADFFDWVMHEGQSLAPTLLYCPLPPEWIALAELKLKPLREVK